MTVDKSVDDVLDQIRAVRDEALNDVGTSDTADSLSELRRRVLGKSGSLLAIRRTLGAIPIEQRKVIGVTLNEAIKEVTERVDARDKELLDSETALERPLDVSLPGIRRTSGALHPTIQLMYELNDAFAALNFAVYEGPEISSEQFEFDALNFPPDHPARESMDTFWLADMDERAGADRLCLRPHLTGSSVRYMLEHEPPLRFVYPGQVYRNETADARHERAFFQYEVLLIDQDVPFTSGKFLVDTILETVFSRPVRTRMRTGFFPFVEPGFEIDMECQVCFGHGCRTCHYVGWLELMPGGCPHPNVLRAGGLDPDRWTGFYVNVGLDRLVMMRYGIDDVRLLHGADLRFLSQFS
jgi:phenylalanyl-tRNA synthetase alpha chain